MDARLVDHLNKRPGVTSSEIFKPLGLITIGKDGLDQIDTFTSRKGGVDQPVPYGKVAKVENIVKPANERWNEQGTDESRRVCKTSEASGRE